MTDIQQQMEHEQQQYEATHPEPFTDEWYARMVRADEELKQTLRELREWQIQAL